MTAHKVFLIVLGITVLVWVGAAFYLLKPFEKSPLVPSKALPQAPVSSEDKACVAIDQPSHFQEFHLHFFLDGKVKEVNPESWVISGKKGGEYTIHPTEETLFLIRQEGRKVPYPREEFKPGNIVQVRAVKIFTPEDFLYQPPKVGSDLSDWIVLEIQHLH